MNAPIPSIYGDVTRPEPPLLVPLQGVEASHETLVGNKAFRLGLMSRRGFRVPVGFCVTTACYDRAGPDGGIDPSVQGEILEAWRRYGIASAAVRSSSGQEDGEKASLAGLFPTTLSVTCEEALLAAVQACFRAQRRRGVGVGSMAVLIQEMVPARAAGILFTAHPVTGRRDRMLVNAVFGLGEGLAAGRVTGDSYELDREGRILACEISDKSALLSLDGERAVPPADRQRVTLTAADLHRLAELGRALEELFQRPQDVEFALDEDGEIVVLQARPIPACGPEAIPGDTEIEAYLRRERERLRVELARLRGHGRLRGGDAVFSNGNIAELLPTPTPMSFGVFREIFAGRSGAIVTGRQHLGYKLPMDATESLFTLICGQPFFNLEIDAGTYAGAEQIDFVACLEQVRRDPGVANYPEFGLYRQRPTREELLQCCGAEEGARRFQASEAFHCELIRRGEELLPRYAKEFLPALARRFAANKAGSRGNGQRLLEDVLDRIHYLKHDACVTFVIAARLGFYFAEMVRDGLNACFGEAAGPLFSVLLHGLAGSRITQQAPDLEQVARGERSLEWFLDEYGHLASNELELSLPRFAEEPGLVETMVQDLIASGREPAREFAEQMARREDAEQNLRQQFRKEGMDRVGEQDFFSCLHLAQAYLPLRETVKYHYADEFARIRSALRHLAHGAGYEDDDLFHLIPAELPLIFKDAACARGQIVRRREERRLSAQLLREKRLPAVVFESGLDALGQRPTSRVSSILRGTGVAPGMAVGRVRVLQPDGLGVALARLTGQEIIVVRSANLGLASILRTISGLIVEVGGVLAHAACQAREAGIPAVVVEDATVLLQDGMCVRVDGLDGTVEILQAEECAP